MRLHLSFGLTRSLQNSSPYLQSDGDLSSLPASEVAWIIQQRNDLCKTMLGIRVCLNSVLGYLGMSQCFDWIRARTISIASSRTIVKLALDGPDGNITYWSVVQIPPLQGVDLHADEARQDRELVRDTCDVLSSIENENRLGEAAVEILKQYLGDGSDSFSLQ